LYFNKSDDTPVQYKIGFFSATLYFVLIFSIYVYFYVIVIADLLI